MAVAFDRERVVTRHGKVPRDVYRQTIRGTVDAGGGTGRSPRPAPRAGLARDTTGGPVTIGGSIALIIIGAILRFAITWTPQYVDIQAMGVILMLGGLVGLAISLTLFFTRRRSQGSTRVTEQRRYIEPPT
jgi:hypothetical protein